MLCKSTHTLVNPKTGEMAFKVCDEVDADVFTNVQRLGCYTIIWVHSGKGTLVSDFSEYPFHQDQMMAFAPFQPFKLEVEGSFSSTVLQFDSNFFCIHKHQKDVACDGVLFNNIYETPLVELDEATKLRFNLFIDQIKEELAKAQLAYCETIISLLKVVLVTASRLKNEQRDVNDPKRLKTEEPFVLQNLKSAIEEHYRSKHSPSEYADLMAMSPKSLARLTKNHFNKTLTQLISERIIIEAKRELYLTNKSVKEIAYELGYDDEYYFSRFFKKYAQVAPQAYRDSLGFGKEMTA